MRFHSRVPSIGDPVVGPDQRRRARRSPPWLGLAAALLLSAAAQAQSEAAPAEPAATPPELQFTLLAPTRTTLAEFQNRWIDWMAAAREGDAEAADRAADLILATGREFGMARLPDLATGAGATARLLAAEGFTDGASIALAGAERFDTGRPENRFAAATVARFEGRQLDAVRSYLAGAWRSLGSTRHRALLFGGVILWLASVVQIAGGLFVCLLMATRGASLVQQVVAALGRYVPPVVALIVVAIGLLWPLPLPGGLGWLMVYWSVLLWGYGGRTERVLLGVTWLLLGLFPVAIDVQRERVALELSPPARMLEEFGRGAISGSVFSDLAALQRAQPDSPAVEQVAADLHRRLGQWSLAGSLYDRVIEAEPENSAAFVGLGVTHLRRGADVAAANAFRNAVSGSPPQAAAHFHLSRLLSAQYDFAESRVALERARGIDRAAVDRWVALGNEADTVARDGGFERADEIEKELLGRWRSALPSWRQGLGRLAQSLPVALVFLVLAIGLQFLHRSSRVRMGAPVPWAEGLVEKLRRIVLPGLIEAEHGQWVRAFLWGLLLVVLVSLPGLVDLGYRSPWGGSSAAPLVWLAALVGVLVYAGLRFRIWWKA